MGIRGDLFRPTLLFQPLIKPGCVRIGGDGHPRVPHGPAILPCQLRVVFHALQTKFPAPWLVRPVGAIFLHPRSFEPYSLARLK